MLSIYRNNDLPELQLNWQWSAGHLLHKLQYEHLREQHSSWHSAINQQRKNNDFFVKELESMLTIRTCMIDSDAAIYNIFYPPGQHRQLLLRPSAQLKRNKNLH